MDFKSDRVARIKIEEQQTLTIDRGQGIWNDWDLIGFCGEILFICKGRYEL